MTSTLPSIEGKTKVYAINKNLTLKDEGQITISRDLNSLSLLNKATITTSRNNRDSSGFTDANPIKPQLSPTHGELKCCLNARLRMIL